jgi:hypothetical protein
MIQTSKHSYWGHKMEVDVAFNSIGFHAALILNRLRNERRIDEDRRANDECGQNTDTDEKAVRAELERVNKRLDLLRSRVRPSRTGRESAG